MTPQLSPIQFDDNAVRMAGTPEQPLFVGPDVCAVLVSQIPITTLLAWMRTKGCRY